MIPTNLHQASPATRALLAAVQDHGEDPARAAPLIEQALAAGADRDFIWSDGVQRMTTLGVFVEEFDYRKMPLLDFLLDHGFNPLRGELAEIVRAEEFEAGQMMLDACIKHGYRGPSGHGVMHALLHCPTLDPLPDLVDYAIAQGADLTPPQNTTWAHVVLDNTDAFPTNGRQFMEAETRVSWCLLQVAVDLGADLSLRDPQGRTAAARLLEKMDEGCAPPDNAHLLHQIQACNQAQELEQTVVRSAASTPSRRI